MRTTNTGTPDAHASPSFRKSGFTLIGSSATRSYTDMTVPAGTVQTSYYTIARRDQLVSPESQQAVIRFGMQVQPGSGSGQLGLAA